jgi:predicted dehydrogenase
MAIRPTRRHFFFGSVLAGALPLKAAAYKSYSDKLRVAAIGCGGQGGVILNQAAQTEALVALCDVDDKRAAANFAKFDKLRKYKDYRVMLDKEGKNIDACTIGIPDHMHATVALECMRRGKHVYVEKPLTRTPWEARLLQDAAVKYKVATQMGNQGYSHDSIRVAAEIIWSGEIGDVTEVHASSSPGTHPTGMTELPRETSTPGELDWNLWLGGASMRPYAPEYTPYNWRGFFDFGTGQIGNWGIHTMGPVNLALQLGAPASVELVRQEKQSKFSFPERCVIRFEFPARGAMPPVAVFWHDSARPEDPESYRVPGMEGEIVLPSSNNLFDKGRGPRPAAPAKPADPNAPRQGAGGPGVPVYGDRRFGMSAKPGVLSGNGAVLVGKKGLMATVERGEGVHLLPASRWKDYTLPAPLLLRSPGHMRDWVRACKGGEQSVSDFRISGPYAEWMLLGVIAMRVPGKLLWDTKTLRFTNSAEANKYVKPVFRPGWELKL